VVLSILLQGFTCAPLLRKLGLARIGTDPDRLDLAKAKLVAAQAGRERLDRMVAQSSADEALARLRQEYLSKEHDVAAELRALQEAHATTASERKLAALRQVIAAQKEALLKSAHEGVITASAFESANRQLDEELLGLSELRTDQA
jgi:hypothetical protein